MIQPTNPTRLVQKVLALWREGKTGTEIANMIGKTRGSVMGIVHRERKKGELGLVRIGERNKFPAARPEPKIKNKRILREIRLGVRPPPEIPQPAFKGLTILDLRSDSCRYIVEESDAWTTLYCGLPKTKGSYCDDHARLCYTPVTGKSERRAKKRTVFVVRALR